ncbi:hypothetical protein KPL70_011721 [Citrus sinensis]|nr:hypothetical protein KPL70_011721 [Citrus sinensis]
MGEEDGDDLDNFDDQATIDMRGRDDRRARHIDLDLGSIKLKIPSFQGKNDPKTYLEWEKKVELVFDCQNYSEEKKVKLAAVEFTDYAIILWDQLVLSSRSVEDYHKKMEIIMIRANFEEEREATMARFLHGLNQDIANVVDLQHYVEFEDMVHMAMKVERQLKKKGSTRTNLVSSSSWKSKWSKDEKVISKPKIEPFKDHKEGGNQSKGKSDSQHSRNREIKCFKCLGTCHIASQCQNKRAMILRDDGDGETESELDDDPLPPLEDANDGVEYPVDGKLMVARLALNMQVKENAEVQHDNIFHTRCHIKDKRCGIRAYHSLYPRPRALALIPTWAGPNSAPKEFSKGEDCPTLISDQELWLASDKPICVSLISAGQSSPFESSFGAELGPAQVGIRAKARGRG